MDKQSTVTKNNILSFTPKISNFCIDALFIIMSVLFGFMSVVSLISTSKIDQSKLYAEHILYDFDNIFINVSITLLFLAALILLGRYTTFIHKINLKIATLLLVIYTTVLSLIWIISVSSIPSADSAIVVSAANSIVNGDYSVFHTSNAKYYNNYSYFQFYPFQLGYVFICEIIFRIFGCDNWFALQFLNIIALDFAFVAIVKLSYQIFKNKTVPLITAALLMGCLQAVLFTSFSYGNLIGLASALWASVFIVGYIEKKRRLYIIPAALLLAFSVVAKYNNLIFLAAISIILILHAIKKKKLYSIISFVIIAAVTLGASKGVIYSYELRSGVTLSGGVSQLLYFNMGLCDKEGRAAGWYNGISMELYRDNDLQIEPAEEQAKQQISERLSYFAKNPSEAAEFFYHKLVSQWNEPTYESIWISQVKKHYNPLNRIGASVYEGTANKLLTTYFNFYQQIIFIGFAAGMIFLFKKHKLSSALIPIVIFGGLVYHMLFEAKSQYILTYFIMMIPFASYGIYRISTLKIFKKLLPSKQTPDTQEKTEG